MVLSQYGSVVLMSDMDFSIWRKKNGIKKVGQYPPKSVSVPEKNIDKKVKELQKQGYQTRVMPIVFNKHQYIEYWEPYTEEEKKEYTLHKLLFRYIYIYERLGIEKAEQWINSFDPKYDVEEIEIWSANKLRLPHCNLINSQCSLTCPYFQNGCQYPQEEKEKIEQIIKKYSFKGRTR